MHQWLLIGGPSDGETLFVADDLNEFHLVDDHGRERRYVKHRFVIEGDVFALGVLWELDEGALDQRELANRILAARIARIGQSR